MIIVKGCNGIILKALSLTECEEVLNISAEFDYYINSNLRDIKSKYELAKKLYLLLNLKLSYDVNIVYFKNAINDYIGTVFKTKSILCDQSVNCKIWALIYTYYLNSFGINGNIIVDNNHMKVEMCFDERVVIADATNVNIIDGFYMSDLTRGKYDIPFQNMLELGNINLFSEASNISRNILKTLLDNKKIITMTTSELLLYIIELEQKEKIKVQTTSLERYSFYKSVLLYLKKHLNIMTNIDISSDLFKQDENGNYVIIPCFFELEQDTLLKSQQYKIFEKQISNCNYRYYIVDNGVLFMDESMIRSSLIERSLLLTPSQSQARKQLKYMNY